MEQKLTTPETPARSAFATLYRSWRYFFWFLGLVVLIAFFYAEENWRARRAWAAYKSKIEASGGSVNSRQFVPETVPRSQNFAETPLLAPLFDFMSGTQQRASSNALERIQNFAPLIDKAERELKLPKQPRSNSWVSARINFPAWRNAILNLTNLDESVAGTNATSNESAATVLKAMAAYAPVFEELEAASKRKYCRFEIAYDHEDPAGILLPHLAILRHINQVLQLKACAELASGQSEQALEDVQLMLYIADASREEPIVVSQLVRMALLQSALQPIAEGMGQWTDPQLRVLQERLLSFDFCAGMNRAFDAERTFFGGGEIDYVQHHARNFNAMAGEFSNLPGVFWLIAPSGWFDFERVNYCNTFDYYKGPEVDLPNHKIRPHAVREAAARVGKNAHRPWPALFVQHKVFAGFMLPGLTSGFRKTAFSQTSVDLAVLACAIERYRFATGRLPESLDQLSKGAEPSIKSVPLDIIDGQPLKYRLLEDGGYLLYSVGWNARDDGGLVNTKKDSESDATEEGDWVWKPLAGIQTKKEADHQ